MGFLNFLLVGVQGIQWQQVLMWVIGATLIYLAIGKDFEPALLLPIGFGAILVNIPFSSMVTQNIPGFGKVEGIIDFLFEKGIATEVFPLLLFVGIGAMIDFGPLLSNPKMLFFGAAAQFGIFGTLLLAVVLGEVGLGQFSIRDAASIGVIGAADGPTSIFVANFFDSKYLGPITVAAYSYMALVPIIQPFAIKLVTTRKERMIRMEYHPKQVSKTTRILFPIGVCLIAGLIAPSSLSLIGMLMFGNLIRECGVLSSISKTAENELANLITLFLGITIASKMQAKDFVTKETFLILGLGLLAFIFDTVFGVLFVKFLNIFTKKKMNPMVGAAGISAFPMSARVIHKMALKEDNQNFILMHTVGANVAGQIASVIAGGLIIYLVGSLPK